MGYSNGTAHLEERVDSPSQKSVEEEKEEELEPEEPYEEEKVMEEPLQLDPEPEVEEEEPQHEGIPYRHFVQWNPLSCVKDCSVEDQMICDDAVICVRWARSGDSCLLSYSQLVQC